MDEKKGSIFCDNIDKEIHKVLSDMIKNEKIPLEELKDVHDEAIEEATLKVANEMYVYLKNDIPNIINDRQELQKTFTNNISEVWGGAINLLESFLTLSIELGDIFCKEICYKVNIEEEPMLYVLIKLYSRACLIGCEILNLIKNGYPDGALARWRSLHEVVVIGSFIAEKGNNTAKRYLDHQIIGSYIRMQLYQKSGYEIFSDEESTEQKREYLNLITKYGKASARDYGWAANVIENPNFRKIEEETKLSYLRPYYKMACILVHADPMNISFNLGLLDEEILLAGPSGIGLADPARIMTISLNCMNEFLFGYKPTIMGIVVKKMMNMWVEEICNNFIDINKKILEST